MTVTTATNDPHTARLHGLPPVVSEHTVVLILGSFPGVASLRAEQYYAHPQNHFWKILAALWPQHPLPPAGPAGYPARCQWLLARGLGVWDVYASCERAGSLDASIRNPLVNDFARLHGQCPQLAAVAHNGAESFKHAHAVLQSLYPLSPCLSPPRLVGVHGAGDGAAYGPGLHNGQPLIAPRITTSRLPSTSPANASWSFERKRTVWADLMATHGLL